MRKSRTITLADTGLFHKMWKGHNNHDVLRTIDEKRHYLRALCDTFNDDVRPFVKWFSFCIMSNHPHETGSAQGIPQKRHSRTRAIARFGDWMRNAHSRFGAFYNQKHARRGATNCGRARTVQIKSDRDVLKVMFYADANPVRHKLVRHPSRYPWSSCHFYCTGEHNEFTPFLDLPPAFIALAHSNRERHRRYRSLLDAYLRQNGLLDDAPSEEVKQLSSLPGIDVAIAEVMATANRARGTPP